MAAELGSASSEDTRDRPSASGEVDTARLAELIEAMAELSTVAELATTAGDPLDGVHCKIADLARRLVRAQYAALGVLDPEGCLSRLVVAGMSEEQIRAVGPWPRGHGLLGALVREKRPIRLANVADDPRSAGFPPHHPPMTSFLGVPILWKGKALGNLYIANKQGAVEFSVEDQRIVEALAAHAAVAIENARLAADLRELSRTREEETRLISHDLRAPLTIILGQAQMVARLVSTGNKESALKASGAIVKSVKRMNELIQDLVDAARLESGRLELRPEPVDMAGFVTDLKTRMAGTVEAERIQIEAASDLPAVRADRRRLERIFVNLLSNALRYSPPECNVTVRIQAHGRDEVLTAVADQGVGIAADELPHLFQRFYRTREARSAEGLGLGLYIAKRLVEAHGGRIWAESKAPGRGSTFYFTLPVVPQAADQGTPAALQSAPPVPSAAEFADRQPRGAP